MSHANNKITKPIDVRGDIAYILGRNVGDVWQLYHDVNSNGTPITNPAVNMWAKRKPVQWNGALNPQGTNPSNWFAGIKGNYGIESKSVSNLQHAVANMKNYIDGNYNGWTYERDNVKARVLDFDGYYHGAQNPFGTLNVSIQYPQIAAGMSNSIRIDGDVAMVNPDSVALSDLKAALYAGGQQVDHYGSFDDLYIGVCFYKQVGSDWVYNGCYITTDKVGDINTPQLYSFGTSQSQLGNYRVYPVLFDGTGVRQDDPSINPSTGCYYNPAEPTCYTMVTFPFMSYAEFSVVNEVLPAVINAEFHIDNDEDDTTLYDSGDWEFTMKASSAFATTFRLMKAQVLQGSSSNPTVVGTLFDAQGATYSLASNGTQRLNGTYKPSDFGQTPQQFYGDGHDTRMRITGTAVANGVSTTINVETRLYKKNH